MRWRNIAIIVLLVLLATIGTFFVYSNTSKNVAVTLKTNGSNVQVEATSIPFFFWFHEGMRVAMEEKALNDVYEDNSTVDSVKGDMENVAHEFNYNATVTIDSQFGQDQLPMIADVKGTSMIPTLQDGQQLVLVKTKDVKVGDIVVAHYAPVGLIVKRVAQINGDQVYLMSDNRQVMVVGNEIEKGLDTWVSRNDIIGVVKEY